VSEPIRSELSRVARALGVPDAPFVLERPRDEGHGDLATNLALLIAERLALEGRLTGQALEHDDTERPQVRAPVDVLAARLLGAHVVRRTHERPGFRGLVAQ